MAPKRTETTPAQYSAVQSMSGLTNHHYTIKHRVDTPVAAHFNTHTHMMRVSVLQGGSADVLRSSQVQLMRGEFLETAMYWAGVVSVRLGAIAERR